MCYVASLVNTLSNVGVYSQPHFGFDGKQTSEASPQRQKTHGTFPLSTRTSISYLIQQNCFDCVQNKMVLRYDYSVYRNFSVKNKGQSDSNLVTVIYASFAFGLHHRTVIQYLLLLSQPQTFLPTYTHHIICDNNLTDLQDSIAFLRTHSQLVLTAVNSSVFYRPHCRDVLIVV